MQPVIIPWPALLLLLPLQVVSNCEQHLTSRYTRRLITMQASGSRGRQLPCSAHTPCHGCCCCCYACCRAANALFLTSSCTELLPACRRK